MSIVANGDLHLNDRLAEAACYAVLQRLLPVLRHDAAGAMQPVRLMLKLLERRVQMPEPDLQAVAKNVVSVSGLVQKTSVDYKNTLGWIASSEDVLVSLRDGVDEAIQMLALEMSTHEMEVVNGIVDGSAMAPQSFVRQVFIGALLALCDLGIVDGALQVTLEAIPNDEHASGRLHMRWLPVEPGKSPASLSLIRRGRLIGWQDVQAMANSFGVTVARGDGWITLELPKL